MKLHDSRKGTMPPEEFCGNMELQKQRKSSYRFTFIVTPCHITEIKGD